MISYTSSFTEDTSLYHDGMKGRTVVSLRTVEPDDEGGAYHSLYIGHMVLIHICSYLDYVDVMELHID